MTLEEQIAQAKEEVQTLKARRVTIVKGYHEVHGGYLKEAIEFANSVPVIYSGEVRDVTNHS